MQYESCVNYLVANGYENAQAEKIIEKIAESIMKSTHAGEMAPELVEKLIMIALNKQMNRTTQDSVEPVEGVVLGFTGKKDRNYRKRKAAMDAYKNNHEIAVAEGLVRIDPKNVDENGDPIPIALHTKYLNKNQTIEDRNVGKDLEEVLVRTVYFLVDGEVVQCDIDLTPKPGDIYRISAPRNGKYFNKAYPDRFTKIGEMTRQQFWDTLMEFSEGFEGTLCDVGQAQEMDNYTLALTTGFVKSVGHNKKGTFWLNLEDMDTPDPLLMFDGNEVVRSQGFEVQVGNELIVFGQIGFFKDQNIMRVFGYAINPISEEYTNVVANIDAMFNAADE